MFGVLVIQEYRSSLGLFSPSGLVSLYSLIKFSIESILVLNYSSLFTLAKLYGVSNTSVLSQSILVSFVVSILSYSILWLLSVKIRRQKVYIVKSQSFRKEIAKFHLPNNSLLVSKSSVLYFLLLILGFVLVISIFERAGGIINYVNNFGSRSEMLAGYGFIIKLGTLFIQLSILYFFINNFERSSWFSYVLIAIGMIILFSLGGRTAPIFLLFAAIVYLHFRNKRFVVSLTVVFLVILIIFIALFISGLRIGGNNFFEAFQSGRAFNILFLIIGGYFSYIIRDSVIISYFSENEFWYGSGLLSFIYAFIPRSFYPDKPVVDNGVYVIAMTQGQFVTPPMQPNSLPYYGWPESYMSGYMEAGWIGLLLGVIISCTLVHLVFSKFVRSNFRIEWAYIYCFFIFRQPLYLTGIDLFNIIFHMIVVLSVARAIRIKMNGR